MRSNSARWVAVVVELRQAVDVPQGFLRLFFVIFFFSSISCSSISPVFSFFFPALDGFEDDSGANLSAFVFLSPGHSPRKRIASKQRLGV